MAFYDDKKDVVSVNVVEAEFDEPQFDEPRTTLRVHPNTLFENGYARVEDAKGNTVLRCDSRGVGQKRAIRRSFHSRIFDMSSAYGESELTVYPPWSNGRLRFDEHFPRRYLGAQADLTLDVRPSTTNTRQTSILSHGEEVGKISQPMYGLGPWQVDVLPGMDEPMVVALTVMLMQQASVAPVDQSTPKSTDSAEMVMEAFSLLAQATAIQRQTIRV